MKTRCQLVDAAWDACRKAQFNDVTFFHAMSIYDRVNGANSVIMCAAIIIAAKMNEYDSLFPHVCKLFKQDMRKIRDAERNIVVKLDWQLSSHDTLWAVFYRNRPQCSFPLQDCLCIIRNLSGNTYDADTMMATILSKRERKRKADAVE